MTALRRPLTFACFTKEFFLLCRIQVLILKLNSMMKFEKFILLKISWMLYDTSRLENYNIKIMNWFLLLLSMIN